MFTWQLSVNGLLLRGRSRRWLSRIVLLESTNSGHHAPHREGPVRPLRSGLGRMHRDALRLGPAASRLQVIAQSAATARRLTPLRAESATPPRRRAANARTDRDDVRVAGVAGIRPTWSRHAPREGESTNVAFAVKAPDDRIVTRDEQRAPRQIPAHECDRDTGENASPRGAARQADG
jgi:hypothetical protein